MTKINKVFDKILICVKPFYFNYIFYFRFPLHNSTGEARPHLPPLTARPWTGGYICTTSTTTKIKHCELDASSRTKTTPVPVFCLHFKLKYKLSATRFLTVSNRLTMNKKATPKQLLYSSAMFEHENILSSLHTPFVFESSLARNRLLRKRL